MTYDTLLHIIKSPCATSQASSRTGKAEQRPPNTSARHDINIAFCKNVDDMRGLLSKAPHPACSILTTVHQTLRNLRYHPLAASTFARLPPSASHYRHIDTVRALYFYALYRPKTIIPEYLYSTIQNTVPQFLCPALPPLQAQLFKT